MTTYLSNHAIKQEMELIRLRPGDPESTQYGLWNAILGLQFPVSQGFITRPQDRHSSQAGAYGFSDLHTYHYRGTATHATKFLIVQCKRPSASTQSSVWRQAVDQLDEYLSNTHGTRRPANRTPVYGIVAIGLKLRVYKYDDVNQGVLNWAPRGSGVKGGTMLNLDKDATKVQWILNHIYHNH
ncbi:hypothetical protein NUU61_005107 [Penicillium alfredii]|uniref:Uncharacterized protein n=1 Tax=Penicillium alfredii TaxID=1506179 RepID=A0A9W9F8W0_9EURO|nr:uncharacterized protein NUU61_005107 [Penicillium alfredii]KAJ5095751.1 hypothetical protein NUU61_005107 [Penicillium alfredii]